MFEKWIWGTKTFFRVICSKGKDPDLREGRAKTCFPRLLLQHEPTSVSSHTCTRAWTHMPCHACRCCGVKCSGGKLPFPEERGLNLSKSPLATPCSHAIYSLFLFTEHFLSIHTFHSVQVYEIESQLICLGFRKTLLLNLVKFIQFHFSLNMWSCKARSETFPYTHLKYSTFLTSNETEERVMLFQNIKQAKLQTHATVLRSESSAMRGGLLNSPSVWGHHLLAISTPTSTCYKEHD